MFGPPPSRRFKSACRPPNRSSSRSPSAWPLITSCPPASDTTSPPTRDDALDEARTVLGRVEHRDLAAVGRARAEQVDLRERNPETRTQSCRRRRDRPARANTPSSPTAHSSDRRATSARRSRARARSRARSAPISASSSLQPCRSCSPDQSVALRRYGSRRKFSGAISTPRRGNDGSPYGIGSMWMASSSSSDATYTSMSVQSTRHAVSTLSAAVTSSTRSQR